MDPALPRLLKVRPQVAPATWLLSGPWVMIASLTLCLRRPKISSTNQARWVDRRKSGGSDWQEGQTGRRGYRDDAPPRLAWCSGRQHTRGALLLEPGPQAVWVGSPAPLTVTFSGPGWWSWLRTPPPRPESCCEGQGEARGMRRVPGGLGPNDKDRGATSPTTLAGAAASPEIKPPRPAVEPAALLAVGT